MKYFLSVILFCFILKQALSFHIDIETCTTSNGKHGFCRPREHCFYKNMTKFEKCPNKKCICCPNSGISNTMCKKYGEAVYELANSKIVMPFEKKSKKVPQCGISAVPLIIGGERANPMEFPHMALIGFGNSRMQVSWLCGGSLISSKYVLTAAHCMDAGPSGPAKWVRLGILNMKNTSFEEMQEIEVEKRIYHPKYNPKVNDIALLKLKKEVQFTPYVRPACIDHVGLLHHKSGIATGWGRTSFDSNHQSDYLMKVQLNIINKHECSKAFKVNSFMPNGIVDSMMCAGVLTGGKDTCQGDSGGPFQVILENPYCMYRIIGVTSYGKFCGFANSPAIYSRVFTFLPWIESVVWK